MFAKRSPPRRKLLGSLPILQNGGIDSERRNEVLQNGGSGHEYRVGLQIQQDIPELAERRADTRPRMRLDQCRGTCRICRLRPCNLPGAHGMDDLTHLSRQCRCELCEGPTLPDSEDDCNPGMCHPT